MGEGEKKYLGEAENSCQRFQCAHSPHVFVIAAVRNPFSFYASYWQMIVNGPDPYKYGCIGREATRLKLFDILDKRNAANRTAFVRFMRFYLQEMPRAKPQEQCDLTMSGIYRRLLLKASGKEAFDIVVTLEDYWASLERALRKVECLLPGSLDFTFFARRKKERPKGDGWNLKRDQLPYRCFFNEEARRLVEHHDHMILNRHGYTFDQFFAGSLGSCENVVD